MDREKLVSNLIKHRVESGETCKCIFQFTTPKLHMSLRNSDVIKEMSNILTKYGIDYNFVDTVCGSYNLNRDWMETGEIECCVEYPGVYPVGWDIKDVLYLEKMDIDGNLIVLVQVKDKNGHWMPNN